MIVNCGKGYATAFCLIFVDDAIKLFLFIKLIPIDLAK